MSKIPNAETKQALNTKEMNIPLQMDNVDWGKKTKLVNRKVSSIATDGSGKNYGSKVLMTKESLTFKQYLNEADDTTSLPDVVISELKKNIRIGARDVSQQWKDALELVRKAYQVSNVRIPLPTRKAAWAQFEDLIKTAVTELSKARGRDGGWRSATVLMKEAALGLDQNPDIGKNRIFVTIPGNSAVEIDDPKATMDSVLIDLNRKLHNKRLDGVVITRTQDLIILDVYARNTDGTTTKRDTIRIQLVS